MLVIVLQARVKTLLSTRELAVEAIKRVEWDKAYTGLVLDTLINRNKLDSRDAAFLNEIVRGTIRWKNRLDWIADQLFKGESSDMPHTVRWILWLAIYQISFTQIPPFAIVNESVNLTKRKKYERWLGVVNGLLRNYLRHPDSIHYPDRKKEPVHYLAVTQSHPEWLVRKWIDQIGFEETEQLCQANNRAGSVTIRINEPLYSCENALSYLTEHGIKFEPMHLSGYFRIVDNNPVILTKYLNSGLFSIQDESAGLPVRWIDYSPGDRILDLCGAPGGKSVAMAEQSGDQCLILSGDIKPARTGLIQETKNRLHLKSVYPVIADAEFFPAVSADIVLLDAPCSGLGVLQKKPDIRWHRTPKDIKELCDLQKRLLNAAASYVKPGGYLIYSTCTVTREENEEIIFQFNSQHPEFVQQSDVGAIPACFLTNEGFLRSWPHRHGIDGSFAAKFCRTES